MKPVSPKTSRQRGMALLLVLISIMALTVIVAGLWISSQPVWEEAAWSRARFQAGLLAESGLTVALHPDVNPGDLALVRGEEGSQMGFRVRITSEGGSIPINQVTQEVLREAAVELFILWGLDASTANQVADSLADWVDEDDEARANGAENAFYAGMQYPGFPANAPFTTLDEMLFVPGMEQVVRVQPAWRNYFTVYGDGRIDLNAAPWDLVMALTGCTRDAAMNFVAVRHGDDGLPDTEDDYRYTSNDEVQALLGLADSAWAEISSLVTLSGTIKRVESIGRVGDFTEKRVILAEETTAGGRTLLTPLARFRN